ncbi:hypothetical protein Naga_101006g1 [Nannochloropsis gaditana]|uniref:Uncharacterized protein n=1 Tax=Nannochloropsis gaditana TaxID=72520 RepID=W7TSA1_9STRA|nr:hypothetical protein Naga_101006g1 [Nannochloropsis gaditana]
MGGFLGLCSSLLVPKATHTNALDQSFGRCWGNIIRRCNGTPAAPTASSSLSSPLCWRNWRDSRGSERWAGLSVEHVEEGEERVIEHREGEPRGGHGINEKSLPFAGRGRDVRCRRWPAVTGEVRVERL